MAKKQGLASIVGENLKRLRNQATPKLSQTALGKMAGVSRTTIAAIEGGYYGSIELTTLARLAKALEVSVDDLMGPVTSGPIQPYVEAFLESPWVEVLKPTDDEVQWLRSLPSQVWSGAEPNAETVAEILRWHRRK